MKTAEILRKLADVIDQHEGGAEHQPENSMPHAELAPVEVDHTDGTEKTTFIAPLQAKLELLKKSVGVDNAYDEQGCDCGCDPCECGPDELEIIKKNAGVPVAAVHELSDDEPLDV
jgi:hypothetical protein